MFASPSREGNEGLEATWAFQALWDKKGMDKLRQELKPNDGGRNQKNGGADTRKCYKCGEVGHISRHCPKKNEKDGKGNSDGKDDELPANWKTTPPKSGEPHTKTVKGTKWYFCSKCVKDDSPNGRWMMSHLTDQHKAD